MDDRTPDPLIQRVSFDPVTYDGGPVSHLQCNREIEDIFLDLTQKFGFQRDSMRNMVCHTIQT